MPPIEWSDLITLVRTVHGEARGEPPPGKIAVAHVVLNRWRRPGWWTRNKGDGIPDDTIAAACRDPYQFSCWLPGDPNRHVIESAPLPDMLESLWPAVDALTGRAPDPTSGATHYYATSITPPPWAAGKTPTVIIGRHAFFANVN